MIYHIPSIIYHISSSVIYHLSNIIYQMSLFNVIIHLSIFVFFAGTAAFQLLLILLVYVSIKRIHGLHTRNIVQSHTLAARCSLRVSSL